MFDYLGIFHCKDGVAIGAEIYVVQMCTGAVAATTRARDDRGRLDQPFAFRVSKPATARRNDGSSPTTTI